MITLVIIGVIAAITIPALISKYHDEQLKTQIKKSYSTISNALNSTITNLGYVPKCWYSDDTDTTSGLNRNEQSECELLIGEIVKKLNVTKYCENNAIDNGCIPEYSEYGSTGCQGFFSKNSFNNSSSAWILGDGSIFISYARSWLVYYDINGFKGPNTPGKDVFALLIDRPKLNSNQLKFSGCSCSPGKNFSDALKDAYK
ncbi:hypothetical protein IKQ26_02620 [bacterium]|nr:hypothetical protein [bacterium]